MKQTKFYASFHHFRAADRWIFATPFMVLASLNVATSNVLLLLVIFSNVFLSVRFTLESCSTISVTSTAPLRKLALNNVIFSVWFSPFSTAPTAFHLPLAFVFSPYTPCGASACTSQTWWDSQERSADVWIAYWGKVAGRLFCVFWLIFLSSRRILRCTFIFTLFTLVAVLLLVRSSLWFLKVFFWCAVAVWVIWKRHFW